MPLNTTAVTNDGPARRRHDTPHHWWEAWPALRRGRIERARSAGPMGEPGGRTARVCPGVRQSTPELSQVQRGKLSSRQRITVQDRDFVREGSGARCAAGAHFFTSTSKFTPSLLPVIDSSVPRPSEAAQGFTVPPELRTFHRREAGLSQPGATRGLPEAV